MTLIDDIIIEITRKNTSFLPKLNCNDKTTIIKNRIKKRYGELLYNKYSDLIEIVINKLINNSNCDEIKRDFDFLFCDCKKRMRSNSWT